jgi:hypothetical protein
MSKIASVDIVFTEQDINEGERRICSDQLPRRKLGVTVEMIWARRTQRLQIYAKSRDGLRTLGRATVRYVRGEF